MLGHSNTLTTEDYIARLIANGAHLTLPQDAVLEPSGRC